MQNSLEKEGWDLDQQRQRALLEQTREEYQRLRQNYNELDQVYRELLDQREIDSAESALIRRELERFHHENIELTKQRETSQIIHDVQLKKIRDNYASQLRDAEQWADRLQAELNREREQHRVQLNELERRLKDSFLTEMNIEKQKSMDLLRKYEHERGHSTQQLQHELITSEKVTLEQRHLYEEQIEQMKREKLQLNKELDTVREALKELHEQTNHSRAVDNAGVNVLHLKEDLLAKETSLFQAQSTITDLSKALEQTRLELHNVQETVHRECMEREHLKEALINARQQLLAMKKNGVLNGNAPRSLHSPPVAFEDIERRVSAPLPFSHSQMQQQRLSSFKDDGSLLDRPLPPIEDRRNRTASISNKAEQLLQNQQRIARLIKHIK